METIKVSSAAFIDTKEHNPLIHSIVECKVIEWNSKGQPLVLRADKSYAIPFYIWPLSLIVEYEKTKGYEIREKLRKIKTVRKIKEND